MITRALVLGLAVLTAQAALAADERGPALLARDFALAAMGDDPALAAGFWTEGPARDVFLARFEHARTVRCRRVFGAVAMDVDVRGDAASALVEVDLAEWNAAGLAQAGPRAFRVELAHTPDGWRVAQWQTAEDWTASRIAGAASSEERRTLAEGVPDAARAGLPGALARAALRLMNQSRTDDGRALVALARELGEAAHDPAALAFASGAESVFVRQVDDDHPRAREVARQGLALAEESGDPDALAFALLRFGRTEKPFGRAEAEGALLRVLAMADAVEDPAVVALSATQLAQSHDDTGEHRTALRFALEAQRYARISGDAAALISANLNIGGSYLQIGDVEMAEPYYVAAYEAAQRAGYWYTAADAALILAQAMEVDTSALTEEMLQRRDPILTAGARADLLLQRAYRCAEDEPAAAEAALQEAFALAPGPQFSRWVVLAAIRYRQERYEETIDLIEAASGFSDALALERGNTRFMLALALQRAGRRDEAVEMLRRELAWFETTLATIPFSPRQLRTFVQRHHRLHETLVWLLYETGRTEEALATADSLKARVLRLLARGTPADVVLPPREAVAKAAAEKMVTRLNRALRTAAPEDRATVARLQDDLTRARTNLQRLEMAAQPAPAVRLRMASDAAAFATEPDTLGLQFVVSRDETLLFTFGGRRGGVRGHRIALSRDELTKLADALVESMEQRDPGWRRPAKRLYDALLAPVARELAGARTLIVVPQDVLWGVPFHALVDGKGRPLIDRTAVEYRLAMDLGEAQPAPHHPSGQTLLAFANPVGDAVRARERNLSPADIARSLPDAETEARSLRELYGGARTRVYVGAEAQEWRFKSEAPRARILHIATHAFADPAWPMYSALLFARPTASDGEDGILEAREIASMKLSAEVAVLSACETGRGEYDWDEGVVGLPWAFLAAGTPAVVVSQWKVASRSTAALMVEFHKRLRQPGTTPASALRGAQRTLRGQTRYAHPFYWAPFVTITGR